MLVEPNPISSQAICATAIGCMIYGSPDTYNKWRICKDAIKKGEELNLPVYKFLEGPLIEKFLIS